MTASAVLSYQFSSFPQTSYSRLAAVVMITLQLLVYIRVGNTFWLGATSGFWHLRFDIREGQFFINGSITISTFFKNQIPRRTHFKSAGGQDMARSSPTPDDQTTAGAFSCNKVLNILKPHHRTIFVNAQVLQSHILGLCCSLIHPNSLTK